MRKDSEWVDGRNTDRKLGRKEYHFECLRFEEPLGQFCVDPPIDCHKYEARAQERDVS